MRVLLALLVCASLAACATAPPAGPPRTSAGNLFLCAGGGISNAPPANSRGRIANYEPYANVRGVTLARAPVSACLSSGFGPRRTGAGKMHRGVDLFTRHPSPVYAGGDGIVQSTATLRGYGKTVLIRHRNGVETRYAHLSSYAPHMRPGARVRRGEEIGRTGKTGNATAVHLHYEVLIDGRHVNPVTVGR